MILTVLKYTNNIFSRDFQSNQNDFVSLSSADLPLVLNDLLIFNDFINPTSITNSSIILKLDENTKQEIISINKDYVTKQIKVNVDDRPIEEDAYRYLSNKMRFNLTPLVWKDRIIDFKVKDFKSSTDFTNYINNINNLINPSNLNKTEQLGSDRGSLSELSTELKKLEAETIEGLDQNGKDQILKLRDSKKRINELQAEIDSYQNEKKQKDDLNNQIVKLEDGKKQANEMIESAKLLIQNRDNLKKEIERFSKITTDPQALSKVEEYKNEKRNRVLNALQNVRTTTSDSVSIVNEEIENFLFGKPIIIMLFLEVLITIAFYILSTETKVIFSGLISIILLVILFVFINLFKDVHPFKKKLAMGAKITYQDLLGKTDTNQEKLIVNYAWFNALNNELTLIESLIKARLNNRSYDDLINEANQMEVSINNAKEEQKKMNSRSLNSEEYYKKRRELDILKIEKENLDYSVNLKDPEKEKRIDELSLRISELEKNGEKEENKNVLSIPLIFINFNSAIKETKQEVDKIRKKYQIIMFELTG